MNGQRLMMLVAAASATAILVLTFFGEELGTRRVPPQVAAPPPPELAAPPVNAAAPSAPVVDVSPTPPQTDPRFELVRISRTCRAYFSGVSDPGALVTVRSSQGGELGRVTANAEGEWSFVPDLALAVGVHQLELQSQIMEGAVRASNNQVSLTVPDCASPSNENSAQIVLELGLRPDQAVNLPPPPGDVENDEPQGISILEFDYKENKLTVAGRSRTGRVIQIYLNNEPKGSTRVGQGGRWSLMLEQEVLPGLYTVRAEPIIEAKKTPASVGLRRNPDLGPRYMGEVIVQPGMTAWEIAEAVYGNGGLYPRILRANGLEDESQVQAGMRLRIPAPRPERSN